MSAPISPGGTSSVSASRSVATATSAPSAWARAASGARSRTRPSLAGYCSRTPNSRSAAKSIAPGGPTWTRIPSGSARAWTTAIVCGWQSSATKNPSRPGLASARHSVMASAAAVASSSSEALASGSPVRSATMVWKLRSASSRPCAISAWYGVYCVYQPGFSSTLRRTTAGVWQSW